MPIYEDEAIVLRHYPIADSDSVIVCIAPELGKIRAVAKGIKKPKNRLTGCLEPLNHIQITLYSREGSELSRISHAELIHSYAGNMTSLNHIFAFSYFAELTHLLVQDNQSNPILFRLLLASLKAVEKLVPIEPLLRYFEVWSLKISGFYPNYDYCSGCGKYVKEEGFFARIKEGHALCGTCSRDKGYRIGMEASRSMQAIMVKSPESFAALPFDIEAGRQIEHLTQALLGHNLECSLKSYRILKDALLNN